MLDVIPVQSALETYHFDTFPTQPMIETYQRSTPTDATRSCFVLRFAGSDALPDFRFEEEPKVIPGKRLYKAGKGPRHMKRRKR